MKSNSSQFILLGTAHSYIEMKSKLLAKSFDLVANTNIYDNNEVFQNVKLTDLTRLKIGEIKLKVFVIS